MPFQSLVCAATHALRWLARAIVPPDSERLAYAVALGRDERARQLQAATANGQALLALERAVLVTMAVATAVSCSGLGLYAGKLKPEADMAAAEQERALIEARERLHEARKRVEEARRRKAEEEGR
jgi:hypothetical protein